MTSKSGSDSDGEAGKNPTILDKINGVQYWLNCWTAGYVALGKSAPSLELSLLMLS